MLDPRGNGARTGHRRAHAVVLLALLITGGLLAGTPDRASADSHTPIDAASVTTLLHPGWNMVGWPGPPTPVADLFDAIPSLERVALWDAAGQRYRSRARTGDRPDGAGQLTAGMGLWLLLGGDAPVEWSRPVSAGGAQLSLHPGWNLVGWAGADGVATRDALSPFGDALTRVARWDAERQEYGYGRHGGSNPQGAPAELRRGDALWVELAARSWWWQSGAVLLLAGAVPDEVAAAIRDELAAVQSFFHERLEAGPLWYTVLLADDGESADAAARRMLGGERSGVCVSGSFELAVLILNASCPGLATYRLDSEHFAITVEQLASWRSLPLPADGYQRRGPSWLSVAISIYTADAYAAAVGLRSWDEIRAARGEIAHRLDRPLADLGDWGAIAVGDRAAARAVSFFAGEWLARHAGEPALIDYFRHLSISRAWREAFAAAFGITLDGFYDAFEAYRTTIAETFSPRQVRGWLRDGDGNPAPGAYVIAAQDERRWEDAARTGDDGSFSLEVVNGRYDIYLSLAATGCVVSRRDGLPHVGMLVVMGSDVAGLELRLPPGSSCDPD